MRFPRIITLLGFLISISLILSHLSALPAYSSGGWFFSPRAEKTAHFSINDKPFNQESWSSRWGKNRPTVDRPHAILSEIHVRVKHESRSSLVEVTVTGDSEAEVDSFIQMLKTDVNRAYSTGIQLAPRHGYSHGEGNAQSSIFYRQSYLWLLIANCIVCFTLWFSMRKKKSLNKTSAMNPMEMPNKTELSTASHAAVRFSDNLNH